jgi:predicted metal-dependent phosphotriesterase family hydrolase
VTQVQTVRGPVQSTHLGVVLPHEHLVADFYAIPQVFGQYDVLDDESLVIDDLQRYRDAGGRTVVDATVPGIGRDPEALRRISDATDVHVIMGCGWYREPWYPPEVNRTSTRELTRQLIHEIEDGAEGSGIRPGIIGEIGSHKGSPTGQEERVFRAAARAAVATGLSVTTHSIYRAGLEHIEIMQEEGLDPSRIVIGHSDEHLNVDYHRAIVRAGAVVQFDQIGLVPPPPWSVERLCQIIVALVGDGFEERILLSTDVSVKSDLAALGGRGYSYLLESFLPRLASQGLAETSIKRIVEENPRRILEPLT